MGKTIASLFEPTIELDEQVMTDYSYGSAGIDPSAYPANEFRGVDFPHINVNDYTFGAEEIMKFNIDCTGIVPKVFIKVVLATSGEFLSKSMPMDGDIVSVYVRGKDDLFKPIRNDYLITSVSTMATQDTSAEGAGSIISIEGDLNIPGLYDETIFSEQGTSFEVMKKLAEQMGLGFATNEDNTDDEMNWICANDTKLEFMKHVTGAAWKDETSFFTFFIDMYYHLNFVNVNDLITYDASTLLALAENTMSGGQYGEEETGKGLMEKCFTNHSNQRSSNFYVNNFKPINNSSQISKNYGYALNTIFYDHIGKEEWQLQAKSLVTEGAESQKVLLRGRANDDSYNNQQKYNYVGIQYNHSELENSNVHENFYFARAHNMMNNLEMDKVNLEVKINKFNLNIYRYENVPAIFFVTSDIKRMKELSDDEEQVDPTSDDPETVPIAVDRVYTGHYLVKGLTIVFSPTGQESPQDSGITETLVLSRREWPSPSGV